MITFWGAHTCTGGSCWHDVRNTAAQQYIQKLLETTADVQFAAVVKSMSCLACHLTHLPAHHPVSRSCPQHCCRPCVPIQDSIPCFWGPSTLARIVRHACNTSSNSQSTYTVTTSQTQHSAGDPQPHTAALLNASHLCFDSALPREQPPSTFGFSKLT
jgi:hypothetical protein